MFYTSALIKPNNFYPHLPTPTPHRRPSSRPYLQVYILITIKVVVCRHAHFNTFNACPGDVFPRLLTIMEHWKHYYVCIRYRRRWQVRGCRDVRGGRRSPGSNLSTAKGKTFDFRIYDRHGNGTPPTRYCRRCRHRIWSAAVVRVYSTDTYVFRHCRTIIYVPIGCLTARTLYHQYHILISLILQIVRKYLLR